MPKILYKLSTKTKEAYEAGKLTTYYFSVKGT